MKMKEMGLRGYRIKSSYSKNNNIVLYVDSNNK